MKIKIPPMPEPQFTLNWRGWGYTVTKPNIGSTDVYVSAQLAARDQQWLELVGPVVEALQLIADTDAVDAALDPQRAVRVANDALRAITEEQKQ